MSIVPGYS